MLFTPVKIKTSVQLNGIEICHRYSDIIAEKVQKKYLRKNVSYGYVNSIKNIEIGDGEVVRDSLTSTARYNITLELEVINPKIGATVSAKIAEINISDATFYLCCAYYGMTIQIWTFGKSVKVVNNALFKTDSGMKIRTGDKIDISITDKTVDGGGIIMTGKIL